MLQRNGPGPRYFVGELMTCCICGDQQRSDPKAESNWRVIVLDGVAYYACPKEFPADDASAMAFQRAYHKFLYRAMKQHANGAGANHA
jgi:hypothetical protein